MDELGKETASQRLPGTDVFRISFEFHHNRSFTRAADTLRPDYGQAFAVQIEVRQREAGTQPVVILLHPTVSHLLEAEDALQNPERMFHLGSDSRLDPVLRPL